MLNAEDFDVLNAPVSSPAVDPIAETPDLIRIRSLPRRDWTKWEDLDELVAKVTAWLQHSPTKCEPRCSCCKYVDRLKPSQAAFLREAYAIRHGGLAPLRVGAGKTLCSFLVGTVIGAKRPLLIVPARHEVKTIRALRDHAQHWRVAPLKVLGYETLSHPSNLKWLENYGPDLIICDESHKLAQASTKAAKRIGRYLKLTRERGVPGIGLTPWGGCAFFALSGTLGDRRIAEYWHYTRWAMRSRAPLPADPFEAERWSKAMGEKVPPDERPPAGALLTLGDQGDPEADELTRARRAYSDRLLSTPGVVSTLEDIPAVGLRMSARALDLPPQLAEQLAYMRKNEETPWGEAVWRAWDLWKHSRSIGCGLGYTWDPPAPSDWKTARREAAKFVREYLRYHRSIDSRVHVEALVRSGELDDRGALKAWWEIEPTYTPNPKPVWLDDTVLNAAAEWLSKKENHRGIVWCEFRPLGERISALTGVPYFRENACDQRGRYIETYKDGPAIISMKCVDGFNLQDFYYKNLFLVPPPKGRWVEQAVGRTHRDGQLEAEVEAEFWLTTRESYQCLSQCFQDSRTYQLKHRQPQKLCYAEIEDSLLESIRDQDIEGKGY